MGRHAATKASPEAPRFDQRLEQFVAGTGKHARREATASTETARSTRGRHARPSAERSSLRERSSMNSRAGRLGAAVAALAIGFSVTHGGIDLHAKPLHSVGTEVNRGDAINNTAESSTSRFKLWKRLGKSAVDAAPTPTPETQNESNFVYYSQYDPIRADRQYGEASYGKTIKSSGCLPTALAMVVSTMTGQDVKPGTIGDEFGPDYYHGGGTEHGMVYAVAEKYNLKVREITDYDAGEKQVIDALHNGGYAVTSGGGDNARLPYFSGGHFIAIREAVPANDTESGYRFKIANPVPSRDLQGSSSEAIAQTEWYNDTYSWKKGLEDAGMHSLYILEKPDAQTQPE